MTLRPLLIQMFSNPVILPSCNNYLFPPSSFLSCLPDSNIPGCSPAFFPLPSSFLSSYLFLMSLLPLGYTPFPSLELTLSSLLNCLNIPEGMTLPGFQHLQVFPFAMTVLLDY